MRNHFGCWGCGWEAVFWEPHKVEILPRLGVLPITMTHPTTLGVTWFFCFFETEGRHAIAKIMSSREEISQLGIEPSTSSLRFGYLSPSSSSLRSSWTNVGGIWVNHIFSVHTLRKFRGFSLGEIGACLFVCTYSRCSPLK